MQKKHIKSAIITVFLFFTLVLLPFSSSAENKVCYGSTAGTVNGFHACLKDGNLHICSNNFPDPNFMKYFIDQRAAGQPLVLKLEDVESRTDINCSSRKIQSLEGIGFFSGLISLNCSGNELTALCLKENKPVWDICGKKVRETLNAGGSLL